MVAGSERNPAAFYPPTVTTGTIYVLAPVHNRRAVTERFVRCLAAQRDQGFHLVLADDGSTDGTAAMVRSIVPGSTVLQGSGHWWWAGSLEKARRWLLGQRADPEDLVLIINDDTTFEPDFLAAGRAAMQAPGRFILLAQPFSMQTGELVALGIRADWGRLSFLPALRPEDVGCFSTRGLFMHRGDFEALGGFHTRLLPHYLSDYEFTIRASRHGLQLRTDPTVRLVMDESTTGTRELDTRSPGRYLRSVLSIRATKNPIYWSTFVLLASPRLLIVPNLVRVWRRFLGGLIRSIRPTPPVTSP
jgi:GT2 family glycosyltransferase